MECVLSFLFIIGLLIYLVSQATRSQLRADNWNRAYMHVANKYGGQCKPGSWFSRPTARFRYGDAHCFLSTVKTKVSGGGEFTQLSIGCQYADLRLEIIPRWRSEKLWPLPGTQEIRTHSAAFDQKFFVRASDPDLAREFLSEGVRWQLDRLCKFMGSDDLYVLLQRGALVIKKPTFIRTQQLLDDFVRFALETYSQAMLTRTEGIEFVAEPSRKVAEQIRCQICGEEIRSELVTCVRCQTPHCRECWEYNGQCATYGCGETRFVVPTVANPVE